MSTSPTNSTPALVDAIVREVLRRLAADSAANSHSASPSSSVAKSPTPLAPQPTPVAAVDDRQPVVLTAKVVTVAALGDQWRSARRVQIRRDAIVTPAARDLLREKGVTLVRSAAAKREAPRLDLAVAIDADLERGPWLSVCDAAVRQGATMLRQADSSGLLAKLVPWLRDEATRLAIWIATRPGLAAAAANRKRGVRAGALGRLDQLAALQLDLAPNLLVLDAQAMGPYELPRILAMWKSSAPSGLIQATLGEND